MNVFKVKRKKKGKREEKSYFKWIFKGMSEYLAKMLVCFHSDNYEKDVC